jgi:hypothetical protein
LPQFYQNHLEKQLKPAEYQTLKDLVYMLQSHRQVSIELLASFWPYPIQFESRRRSLQRFLKLDCLNIESLWFPLVKEILKAKFNKSQLLKLAIDRTQWRSHNVFMVSLPGEKRSIPLYWRLLDKRGCSNLCEQKALITPVLELLSDYKVIVLGDSLRDSFASREFGSVNLAWGLCQRQIKFIFRVKQGRYIQEENSDYIRLSDMGLVPGTSFYLSDVKFTKQKGFGTFDMAGYWRRKYRGKQEDEGWYLLTNVGNLKQSINIFQGRSGIEAMFKDCKTGGYNLEKSHANNQRLSSLILLIAIAYSCAVIQGQKIKTMGIQKYVGRLTEYGRSIRRHSSFWIGLYGQSWAQRSGGNWHGILSRY